MAADPATPAGMAAAGMRMMLTIRRFEEALIRLHERGDVPGHFHVSIGQEALPAAIARCQQPEDTAFTTHRSHGQFLASGTSPYRLLAEILGKADGCAGGRGGTLHPADRTVGLPVTSGMVGGSIPVATGVALSARRKRPQAEPVAISVFGDGATEEGAFYEALNLAQLWELPILYVCENNSGYVGAKPTNYRVAGETSAARDFRAVADAFELRTSVVAGNELEALHGHVTAEYAYVQRECRPAYVEVTTARWPGSVTQWPSLVGGETDIDVIVGDAAPAGEIADWVRGHDPLRLSADRWLDAGALTADQIRAIDGEVVEQVARAVSDAVSAPFPAPASVHDHVRG